MVDYHDRLQSGMQPIVREILDRHFSAHEGEWTPVTVAAALHFYIHRKIPYERRHEDGTRPFRPPTETWRTGGNCEEKTVTLASLYDSLRGVETRMLSVFNDSGDGHLLVEAGVDASAIRVNDALDEFYERLAERRDTFSDDYRSYYVTDGDRRTWYVADPEMGGYLGDAGSLSRKGYVSGRRIDWEWVDLRRYTYPDEGRIDGPAADT
ncbi:hypothetical protein [Haloparvum sedimenti]|uniref:hypothetical protein n=1 Tax=Haloparvum sedimenti TaxID=1678448 RepID=UPI000F77C449|nr:hypothetical protein [Haloparvum sedimenti]